jgi:plasmid stabilization system protein ParE
MAAHVGHAGLSSVARSVDLEWSDDALADLDRFAVFLRDQSPELAAIVAQEIVARAQVLSRHPKLGRPLSPRKEYRQLVLDVLGAPYVFQYRYDGNRLVVLRVFHGREASDAVF